MVFLEDAHLKAGNVGQSLNRYSHHVIFWCITRIYYNILISGGLTSGTPTDTKKERIVVPSEMLLHNRWLCRVKLRILKDRLVVLAVGQLEIKKMFYPCDKLAFTIV